MPERYNNKVMFTNEDGTPAEVLMDLTGDTATAADVLEGRTLHLASGAPAVGTYCPSDEIEARLEATVGHSSKNLFEITAETSTSRQVTFTVDKAAGTITTSGTATGGSAIFYLPISADVKGDFYYSGCAEGGTSSTYYIDTYDEDTGAKLKSWDGTTPTSNCYYLTQSRKVQIPQGHNNCSLRIVIARNVNADGLVFKPMIRDPRIADDEPEPYVQPTDDRIVSLEQRIAALEALHNNS